MDFVNPKSVLLSEFDTVSTKIALNTFGEVSFL